MRSLQLIIISLLSLCLGIAAASAIPGKDPLPRQDDPPSASSNSPAPSSSSGGNFPALTTTTTASPAPSSTNAPASPSTGGSAATASSTSNGPGINSTALTTAAASPSTSIDPSSDEASLPIEPQLTAAFAVAGVILLVSGIIHTFVGIKSRSVQVFISTAYLISLGITVLICYVLSPPVSAGTEGAYLAAIVLPGLIIGAGACVFKDVTEGLGCAVGGFTLGMWFLTVKAGGLIENQTGKIIFLCCFTGIGFSFSFSRYTRTYAIIGATAFAGATALVLGIDCFSRTGLKEFWIYIWGLNSNLFPLGTHTYPLTKNLKAEIAGIPITTLFGILSQIKVWNIVQKKRAKRAEVEEKKAREKEDEEARLGKDLEARNQAEKMIWERTYADAPRDIHSDSGIGSEPSSDKGSARNSVSDKGKAEENVSVTEIDELASSRNSKAARRLTPHIIVSVAEEVEEEDSLPARSPAASPKLPPLDFGWGQDHDQAQLPDGKSASNAESEIDPELMESLKNKSLKPKTVPTPVVVPLPFKVPSGPPSPRDDDASSVATAATSVKRMSKRWSTNSLFEKMTKGKGRMSYHAREASDATSVQAIVDTTDHFETSSATASRQPSVDGLRDQTDPKIGSTPTHLVTKSEQQSRSPKEPASPRTDYFSAKRISQTEDGLLSPPPHGNAPSTEGRRSSESSARGKATESGEVHSSSAEVPQLASPTLNLESIKASASGTSKVMNAFRTNEWAKHLEGAQEPEEDNLPVSEPPSPTYPPVIAASSEDSLEDAKLDAHVQSAPESQHSSGPPSTTSATPPPSDEQAPKATWPKPSSRRRTSAVLTQAPTEPKSATAISRQASREGRSSSRMTALRSSSGSRTRGGKARQPSQQPLVTSPIQEDVEAFFPPPQVKRRSTFDMQPDSLLAHRESMIGQSSIVRSASQTSNYPTHTASRTSLSQGQARPASTVSRRSSNPEQFMLPQRQPSAASLRSSGQPYSPPTPVRTYSPVTLAQPMTHTVATPPPDRPLHYKNNTVDDDRRSNMLAQWRASLAGDQQQRRASQLNVDVEAAQAGQGWLNMQRQQRESERYRQQAVGWGTERVVSPTSVNVNPMQNQMAAHDAHREILRRMQSKSKVRK